MSVMSAEGVLSRLCSDEELGNQSCDTSFIDTDDESEDEYELEGDFVDTNGIQLLINPTLLTNSVNGSLSQDAIPLPSDRDSLLLLDIDLNGEDDKGKCIVCTWVWHQVRFQIGTKFFLDTSNLYTSDPSLPSNDNQVVSSSLSICLDSSTNNQVQEDTSIFQVICFEVSLLHLKYKQMEM